jgi:hypothetical protein
MDPRVLVAAAVALLALFGFFVWSDGHTPMTYGALAMLRRHDATRAIRVRNRWAPYVAGIAAGAAVSVAAFYGACLVH